MNESQADQDAGWELENSFTKTSRVRGCRGKSLNRQDLKSPHQSPWPIKACPSLRAALVPVLCVEQLVPEAFSRESAKRDSKAGSGARELLGSGGLGGDMSSTFC